MVEQPGWDVIVFNNFFILGKSGLRKSRCYGLRSSASAPSSVS